MRGGYFALLLVFTPACEKEQPVVIDGSSQESFERTAAAARRQLPDTDRILFDRAMRTVGGRRHAERDPAALARVTFDGMTAEQVVEDARTRK
jgi:predicted helicase